MNDHDLACMLLDARHGRRVATGHAPANVAEAYAVQRLVMDQLGPIGGWKVGSPAPNGPISCAPLPASTVSQHPQSYDSRRYTQREVESEICFRLAVDLPAGPTYSGEQIQAAVASCHPGIEILQSRYASPDETCTLSQLADLMQTGAYAWGEPIEGWQQIDFATTEITQTITGGPAKRGVGNPAGDMIRLLVWLANEGAVWAGGLRAGQILTCGSWTGKTVASAGSVITAAFDCARPLSISFTELGE
jgi:2-keto-4-pentenoate hydratase